MEGLPDEIYHKIYTYINPVCKNMVEANKYKYGVLWCKKCGEFLKGCDWCLMMGVSDVTVMTYICNNCDYDNIYVKDEEWTLLLDYIVDAPSQRTACPLITS